TAKDIVDGLNGDLSQEDLIGFDYIKQAVHGRLNAVPKSTADKLATIPLDKVSADILGEDKLARLKLFTEMGADQALPAHAPGYQEATLRRIQGTEFESLMLAPEMETQFDRSGYFQFKLGDSFTTVQNTTVPSVVHWGTKKGLDEVERLNNFAAKNNLWLEQFSDPAIVGLAREMQRKKIKDDDLRKLLKENVYRAVMLHELGHTVGLRHNFGGSADPLNYHDEYWKLRAKTLPSEVVGPNEQPGSLNSYLRSNCTLIDPTNEAECEEQANGRMAELQYSTIMDYGARFNSDFNGLGRWDRAALASAYGNLVEVFDESVGVSADVRAAIQDANRRFSPGLRQGLVNAMDLHYTDLPSALGGVANLGKRKLIPRAEWQNDSEAGLLKVPYMSCYDEYVDAVDSCHRWDHGPDNYEITMDYIQRYKENYVFNNFQRDRVGFSGREVLLRVATRYLLPITNMYQHWLFGTFGRSQNTPQAALASLATVQGFNTLWNVMATPEYGSYDLNQERNTYTQLTDSRSRDTDRDLVPPPALYVEPGVGRRSFSRYDYSSGYNVYDRVLESGHFYEQMAAIIALTSSDASVIGLGADVGADGLRYSIPYYLIFSEELNTLFGAAFSDDFARFSPRVANGQLIQQDVFRSVSDEVYASAPIIETPLPFSSKIQSLLYASAFFKSNYDTEFLQKSQIAILGSGEDSTPPVGFEPVTAYNPVTGRSYIAYRPIDPGRHGEGWLGAELVARLLSLDAAWEATADPDERRSLSFEISDIALDIEIVRGLYAILNNSVF
ncbi:MAG: hypothetical protein RJA70_2184, partial [Pseudomonadota bacterium]